MCGTATVKREDSVFTNCPNVVCPGRQRQLLKHFVSRGAMDIAGLGELQVAALLQAGLVTTAADLYTLTPEQLYEKDEAGQPRIRGMAEKSAGAVVDAIQRSKTQGLARLLFGVGVGLLTYLIRTWGGYPDGIAFAVLLMNLCVPALERFVVARRQPEAP